MRDAARDLALSGGYGLVEAAFLDLASPDLEAAVSSLITRGASRIVVIPYFLTLGTHVGADLPRIVERLSRIYHNVEIHLTAPLDGHPGLGEVLLDRARDSVRAASQPGAKVVLLEIRDIAPAVRHFVFEAPELDRLDFVPGQFVSFTDDVGGRAITRAYSICSPPDGNQFELCANLVVEGAFTPHLFRMRPGDTVQMQGPLGDFKLRPGPADSLFVATGTGIAPIRSMLLARLPRDDSRSYTLLFGTRHETSLLYGEEFERLAARHRNFRFLPTLSRPSPEWRGLQGHVQKHLPQLLGARRDADIYICGLKAMVNDVRSMLKGMGFDRRRILHEKYD